MAARAQVPLREVPMFEGRPQDDVVEWLQEYRDVSDFNNWTVGQRFRHVKWALKGYAKNWYRMLQPEPDTFDAFSIAIRAAFKHPAYDSGIAAELNSRRQGVDESPVLYCYEKLNLCRKVDPEMTEGVKLQHLISGMKPTMVERVYPSVNFVVPNTNAFIQQVQLYHQATWVANSNKWVPSDSVETPPSIPLFSLQQTPGTSSEQTNAFVTRDEFERELKKHRKDVDATLTTFKRDLTNDISKELGRQLDLFRESVVESSKNAMESVAESLLKKLNENNAGSSLGKRSVDGRSICNGCHKAGHIERNCLANTPCSFCTKLGHLERDCYAKKARDSN